MNRIKSIKITPGGGDLFSNITWSDAKTSTPKSWSEKKGKSPSLLVTSIKYLLAAGSNRSRSPQEEVISFQTSPEMMQKHPHQNHDRRRQERVRRCLSLWSSICLLQSCSWDRGIGLWPSIMFLCADCCAGWARRHFCRLMSKHMPLRLWTIGFAGCECVGTVCHFVHAGSSGQTSVICLLC